MSIDVKPSPEPAATDPAVVGTELTLPVDAVRVPVKRCCGILLAEECDCAAFAAEARGVFSHNVIMCRPASQWGA